MWREASTWQAIATLVAAVLGFLAASRLAAPASARMVRRLTDEILLAKELPESEAKDVLLEQIDEGVAELVERRTPGARLANGVLLAVAALIPVLAVGVVVTQAFPQQPWLARGAGGLILAIMGLTAGYAYSVMAREAIAWLRPRVRDWFW